MGDETRVRDVDDIDINDFWRELDGLPPNEKSRYSQIWVEIYKGWINSNYEYVPPEDMADGGLMAFHERFGGL